jgi:hypothetical protein
LASWPDCTHLLDFCRDELKEAFEIIRNIAPVDLSSSSLGDARNATTLSAFQRLLAMPVR